MITYREQFDAALKAYNDHGNAKLSADDSAMHFFAGLDQGRYGQMKTTVHNNMTIGAQKLGLRTGTGTGPGDRPDRHPVRFRTGSILNTGGPVVTWRT